MADGNQGQQGGGTPTDQETQKFVNAVRGARQARPQRGMLGGQRGVQPQGGGNGPQLQGGGNVTAAHPRLARRARVMQLNPGDLNLPPQPSSSTDTPSQGDGAKTPDYSKERSKFESDYKVVQRGVEVA